MSACFYCRNHTDAQPHPSGVGHAYSCKHGLDTEKVQGGPEDVMACEQGEVQYGFQIGGYYRHMRFEGMPIEDLEDDSCLEWYIDGDADYPGHEKVR